MSDYPRNNGNIRAYIKGSYNVICDVCGRKRKRFECKLAYGTGDIAVVMSCIDGCADYRHPLNSPPPIIFDGRPVPDARPPQTSPMASVTNTDSTWLFGNWPGNPTFGNIGGPLTGFGFEPIFYWGQFP